VKFDTYTPGDILKPYIRMLAISESEVANEYKVLPGTELVIGFQYKGRLSHNDGYHNVPLASSGITGIMDQYRIFSHAAGIGSVLVFFKEGAGPSFFHQPIHELFRESLSLDHFMLRSELLILEERLQASKTDAEKISIVEDFLISILRVNPPDQLVVSAISLIYQSSGNIRVNNLLSELHVSQSVLEKRFRQVVGTSPKKFASIVRFKHTLNAYNSSKSLTDLGYEAGFYDQAHFIKEIRHFTGESPETFFNSQL
jgi:AraC-like DNA-binding protein